MKLIFYLTILFFILSCSRTAIKSPEDAFRLNQQTILLEDSLGKEHFINSLKKHLLETKNTSGVMDIMTFGKIKISKEFYLNSLEKIILADEDWVNYISNHFYFLEVYGREDWGEVFVTGYYEPKVFGSKNKTSLFTQAIYKTPHDFIPTQKYYSREEIDQLGKLQNQNLELAWVSPFDAFLIQIQGSGLIEFEDQSFLRVGYDNQNGHKYEAIGKHLTHVIPLKEMTMQKIRSHFEYLSPVEQQQLLNLNPSYVFFRPLEGKSKTFSGTEVIDQRTIATDKNYFPKGALAFLEIEIPIIQNNIENKNSTELTWKRQPRFVFDQDTGGAIKGSDRVDLYFGSTQESADQAGVMKRMGRLYYLIPKIEN